MNFEMLNYVREDLRTMYHVRKSTWYCKAIFLRMPWTEMTRSSNVIRRHMRDRDLTDSLCIHAPKTLKETDTTQKAKYHPPHPRLGVVGLWFTKT